jgi:hypothetical protein
MRSKFYIHGEPKIVGIRDGLAQADLVNPTGYSDRIMKNLITLMGFQPLQDIDITQIHEKIQFKLRRRAKVTDVISFAPYLSQCDYLLSKRLGDLIMKYPNSCQLKEIELLSSDGEFIDHFYLMQTIPYSLEYVDFEKSTFFTPDINKRPWKLEKFIDSDDYISKKRELIFGVRCCELNLNVKDFDQLNLVCVPDFGIYVSDALHQALIEQSFSNLNLIYCPASI